MYVTDRNLGVLKIIGKYIEIDFEASFRGVFLKYAERGLVNDRYYYNMNMFLFNVLFWFSNISLFAINQGILWVHFFKYGESNFQNAYR